MFGKREQKQSSGNTLSPIWNSLSLVLDVVRDGPRIYSLVYSGRLSNRDSYAAVRRIEFSSQGSASVVWEYQFPDHYLSDGSYGRLGEQLILPADKGGAISVDLKSGERLWEVNYTSPLRGKLQIQEEKLLLVFQDQAWLKVNCTTGSVLESGRVTNDDQLSALTSRHRPLLQESFEDKVQIGGSTITACGDYLEASGRGDRAPKAGKYPLEDWKSDDHIGVVDEKVVVWLENKWDEKKYLALGILASNSLEPKRLLRFGVGSWSTDCDAMFEIDGLLWIKTELLRSEDSDWTDGRDVSFLIDVKNEAFAAYFAEGQDCVFWHQNEPYWKGLL